MRGPTALLTAATRFSLAGSAPSSLISPEPNRRSTHPSAPSAPRAGRTVPIHAFSGTVDVIRLRDRLLALRAAQPLAAWLAARPHLGYNVFACRAPEWLGTGLTTAHQAMWSVFVTVPSYFRLLASWDG
jgi:hypothetical protein